MSGSTEVVNVVVGLVAESVGQRQKLAGNVIVLPGGCESQALGRIIISRVKFLDEVDSPVRDGGENGFEHSSEGSIICDSRSTLGV